MTPIDRLERLERENRRLKQAGVLALAVVAAVGLMGQATGSKVAQVIVREVPDLEAVVEGDTPVGS